MNLTANDLVGLCNAQLEWLENQLQINHSHDMSTEDMAIGAAGASMMTFMVLMRTTGATEAEAKEMFDASLHLLNLAKGDNE